jgi:competence protein ComEC
MSRLRRYLFNRSNIFVIFLVLVFSANIYLSIRSSPQVLGQRQTILRTESIVKDSFNNYRITFSDSGGYWLTNNYKGPQLKLGVEIQAEVKYIDFDEQNKFTLYNLSKGYKGNIEILSIFGVKGCDLQCKYIGLVDGVKNGIGKIFLESSCNGERWLTKFLAPKISCQDISSLSKGLLIGNVSFSQESKEVFRKTGINHLVAVSGFQVVLIGSFLEWLFLKFQVSKRSRLIAIILSVIGFLTLVGPEPPILRSVLSIIISFMVILMGRRVPQNKVLIYSALILLTLNPFLIFSISFQLSYLASFALINSFSISVPEAKNSEKVEEISLELPVEEKLIKWSRSISGYLVANISIFLYTLPIIVSLNGYVSIWSILINIILVPMIPIVSLLNIFALIPFVGQFINIFPLAFESILLELLNNEFLNTQPLKLSPFGVSELIVYYFVLIVSNILIKYYIDYREIKD